MRKFCRTCTLDKEEKRYDIYSSIGYRCIYKMSASKIKKKVGYITLKVLRDTHCVIFQVYGMFWVLRECYMASRSRLQETNALEISFLCILNQ